ncbi:MAG: peptidylprolyl isomerase [candidate division Zixibacteria bacterium]|nr:peptidylprolyl isomerase [candidate division Zixibacteria bacterium]
MKLKLFSVLMIFSFVLVSIGCSKDDTAQKDAEKVEQQKKSKIVAEDSIQQTYYDSLAVITYPVRNADNPFVTILTDDGKMVLELYRGVAPIHVDSFLARSTGEFYDGTIFHRVIKHFMIQGGDPTGTGTGNAGYFLNAEFSDLPHQEGTLSMARGNSPNSASCQFFVCLERNRSTQSLDNKYTVFGQLISGYDVLHKIGNTPVVKAPSDEMSKPTEDIYLRKAYKSDKDGNAL